MKKLAEALFGIEPAEGPNPPQCYVSRVERPPSYLLKIALGLHLGKLYRGGEKSDWEVAFRFRGKVWLISDWKCSSWTLLGPQDSEEDFSILLKKIEASCAIINSLIQKEAKQHFMSDNFSLHNQFGRTYWYYQHFRDVAEALFGKDTSPPRSFDARQLTRLLNKAYQRNKQLDAAAAAAILFFFAFTEILFDSAFALGDRAGLSYRNFRQTEWSERFRFVLPLSEPAVQETYEALNKIRKTHRNALAHSSPTILVSLPGIGLVPSDAEDLFQPLTHPWWGIDKEEALRIFSAFDSFVELFRSHEKTRFAYAYAETGLALPIRLDWVQDLRSHMTSMEDFQEELKRLLEIQVRLMNMEA